MLRFNLEVTYLSRYVPSLINHTLDHNAPTLRSTYRH